MNISQVTVVRIYLTEGEHRADALLEQLHDIEKVRGATLFRGISGFGPSGKVHTAKFVDLAFDQPLVIEFFDAPDRIETILEHIQDFVRPGRLLRWNAEINTGE